MKKILLGILLLFISFGGYSQNPAKFKDGIELEPINAPVAKFGRVYFDTAQNIFFGYDGTEWLNLGVKATSQAQFEASSYSVTWNGTSLSFAVIADKYFILGTQYSATPDTVTLDAADVTNDRIDIIIANTSGAVSKITGTPAPNPAEPNYNLGTELPLKFILVKANATEPSDPNTGNDFIINLVYDEDTGQPGEWDNIPQANTDYADATVFHSGLVSTKITPINQGRLAIWEHPVGFPSESVSQASFWLKLSETGTDTWLNFDLMNSVSLERIRASANLNLLLGFDINSTAWQKITFDISDFLIGANAFVIDRLKFYVTATSASIVVNVDEIYFQSGSGTPPQEGGGVGTTPNLQTVANEGSITTTSLEANSFVTTGGLSTEFVMGDGTLNNFSGWSLLGNSGTLDGTNFIGTTDNIPLTFRVNNIQAGKIDHIKQNYSLGFETLLNNTTGFNNVAIGHESLKFNTEGFSLTAIGGLSLNLNTIGYDNTSIGEWTLAYNLTGQRNLAVGGVALNSNTTGDSNTAVGQYALNQNRTGDNNTAIGRSALNTVQGTHKAITSFSDYSGTVAGTVKATSIAHGRSTSNSVVISPTNPWGTGYKGTHIITVIDVDNFYFTDTWTTTGTAEWSLTGELGLNNTALGMDAGSGIVTGSGNTIIGYQIGNVAATLENNIILSSAGISRAQYDGSKWNYSDYGSGAITGTPTYNLQVDRDGNIVESVGLTQSVPIQASNYSVTWTSGLSFDVTASKYFILNTEYSASPTTIVLVAADGSNDRIDLIGVNTSGNIIKITGVPAPNPAEPNYDLGNELPLKFILVKTSATEPSNPDTGEAFSTKLIYAENVGEPTEFTSEAKIDVDYNDSFTTPHSGTRSTEISRIDINTYANWSWTTDAGFPFSDITDVTFWIKLSESTSVHTICAVYLQDNFSRQSTVNFNLLAEGIDINSTAWQEIVLDISRFPITPNLEFINRTLIQFYNEPNASLTINIDDYYMNNGSSTPNPSTGSTASQNLQSVTNEGNITTTSIEASSFITTGNIIVGGTVDGIDIGVAIPLNTAKDTNVSTNLSEGTTTNTTVDVNSSDGTNATLAAASTSRAGVMTKAKFDEVVASTSKLSGIEAGATGDQTSIVGILGTKAQFNTSVTDGVITYVGDNPILVNDAASATVGNVGTLRYRVSGNNSYIDIVMQTGASSYAWINIVQNTW